MYRTCTCRTYNTCFNEGKVSILSFRIIYHLEKRRLYKNKDELRRLAPRIYYKKRLFSHPLKGLLKRNYCFRIGPCIYQMITHTVAHLVIEKSMKTFINGSPPSSFVFLILKGMYSLLNDFDSS